MDISAVGKLRIERIKAIIDEMYFNQRYGDILEFGVYEGNSLSEITLHIRKRKMPNKIYGFDSFCGLPSRTEKDSGGWEQGSFKSSLSKTKQEMTSVLGHLNDVKLIKGFYEKTLTEKLKAKINNISLIHIDCDYYSSTKLALDWCKEKIKQETIIIFDEWSQGENRAFNEFTKDNNILFLDYTNNVEDQKIIKII